MKVIARIKCREQMVRMLRVAHDLIEVDDRVEVASRTNPLVDCLPIRLNVRSGMVEVRIDIGKNCAADDLDAVRLCTRDDLRKGCEDAAHESFMLTLRDFAFAREHAKVVDSLKNNEVTNTGLC